MTTMTAEMATLKTRLRTTWMSGDYGHFAKYLETGALEFLARLAIPSGTRMASAGLNGAGAVCHGLASRDERRQALPQPNDIDRTKLRYLNCWSSFGRVSHYKVLPKWSENRTPTPVSPMKRNFK